MRVCGVLLCSVWCCVPLWAHSTSTSTFVRLWQPGCCQRVLLWPCVREMVAGVSRGGLASERVLGEWADEHTIVFW